MRMVNGFFGNSLRQLVSQLCYSLYEKDKWQARQTESCARPAALDDSTAQYCHKKNRYNLQGKTRKIRPTSCIFDHDF